MRHRKHFAEKPNYRPRDYLFTCEVHHGGTVHMEKEFTYTGCKKDYFDSIDPDEFSLLEFETMAEQLGYSKEFSVWCRTCGEKDPNPKLIMSDQELMAMIGKILKKNRVLQCFLHHKEVEVQGVHAENEVVVQGVEAGKKLVVEDVEADKEVEVEVEDDGSDFYDPNNDVEADDDDITFEENVIDDSIRRDWIVPYKSQSQTMPSEEDSDYAPSDVLISGGESDDDDTSRRYLEFNAVVDMSNPQFQIGMVFGSFDEFKSAIKEYAIKQRRNIHFKKNDTVRVKAICKNGCPWNIWASQMGNGTENVQVKTYNPSHTCSNEHNIKFLSVHWLVKKYLDTFRADPNWSLSGIQHRIRTDLYLEISRQKAWNVRSKALKIILGNEAKQYSRLNCYASELKKTNPGSTVVFDLRNSIFKRAYFCLAACKEGFLAGCRPIISLDGCFLKTRYGGQLLSAVAIDANDCIFPVAYAVVETENSESWRWFLQLVGNDLQMNNSHAWTFMSDRQKGLVPMLKSLFPSAEHRFCVRHLHGNYSDAGYKGKALKEYLWNAAMATYVADHDKKMKELQVFKAKAFEWLSTKPKPEWTKSHFSTQSKSDMLLNNLCEVFNKYIIDARDKPIITMLEIIRTKLMRRFQTKRDEMLKYNGSICPKIQKKLDRWKDESFKFNAIWNGEAKYQVTGLEGQFVVNIATSSCDCRRWDLTGEKEKK
ncbi:hypothetical protein LUZ63_009877 [Rhynchospora breviuscula]|uniref:Transposase n=1 Tax=Rhynchospora breviuscula TaxID=2022672 RepID=A0A9Q0HP26_9POAL|nr:hypothetical protein LUZ63_009877 [Rhynchospora breviuscula]